MNGIALITGATAGIGRATALLLAENEYNVIITGRRSELLDKLELEIKSKSSAEVLSLCFDVRERKAVQSAVESIPENWKSIDILVNNAGLAAGFSPIQEGDIDDWEQMIDTNIKGLLYVTRAISPGMVERKTGHIINIGSIAGKEVYEKGNVYCGTKFAVDALSRGMRIDLVDHGGQFAFIEALVAFGGPILGTVAALVCLVISFVLDSDFWQALAYTGFWINFFMAEIRYIFCI